MIKQVLVFAITTTFLCSGTSFAADWPRLGGPDGHGTSPETGLAHSWPTQGPKVLWSMEISDGYAGAAVSGEDVFLLDRSPDQEDVVLCLNAKTGQQRWRQSWPSKGTLGHSNGSRNVPTVDAEHVYALGPLGAFRCLNRKTGEVLWGAHLVNDFKDPEVDILEPARNREEKLARAQVPLWGLTQSPLLYKDCVIVAPQTRKVGLVAYEVATGKIRWRSDYVGRNWYSHVSPTLTTLCGMDQILMLAQPSDPEKSPKDAPPAIITSLDPNTGAILWTNLTPAPYKIPIPQPLPLNNDRIFITGGYGLGCFMLQITHASNQWQSTVLFRKTVAASHIHSPIPWQDKILLTSFKEHGAEKTGLVCLNTNGEALWQTGPGKQFDHGATLVADGMIFIMNGKTGELSLYALKDTGPQILASAKVLDAEDGNVWAPMALSNGRLFVRDQHQLKCLDVRASQDGR